MIDAVRKSFKCQLDDLGRSLQDDYHKESPDSNFAHYIFFRAGIETPFSVAEDVDITSLESNRLSEAPTIAAIGYGLACGRSFNKIFLDNWFSGLVRLSSREVFTLERASFFYRPTELLGIVLGVKHLHEIASDQVAWLRQVLIEGEERLAFSDFWTFLLSAYAARILDINWKPKVLAPVQDMTLDDLTLVKWLCSIDSSFANEFGLTSVESAIDKALLENCIGTAIDFHGSSRASLLYFSLEMAVDQIIQTCWNDFQGISQNPELAVEWMMATCKTFHTVTQSLRSQFPIFSSSDNFNIRTVKVLAELLTDLESDINDLRAKIRDQLRIMSPLIVSGSQVIVSTGDNVTMTNNQESITNSTSINAPASNIGFINSGNGTVSSFSQNIGQNSDDISRLINSLREVAKQFPEEQRLETFVTLDDLQADINDTDRLEPQKIKIRLRRLVIVAGAIAGFVAGAADFSNNVLELHEKLGMPVPVELEQLKLNQQ